MKNWILPTCLNKILVCCLPLLLAACDSIVSSIPERDVYLKRYLYDYQLQAIGKYIYITTPSLATDRLGYGGLLVIHALDNNYYAFDLACPHEAIEEDRIGAPNELCICKCPVCGEEYDLSAGFGSPINGISKEALKRYTVTIDDNDFIIVTR